MDTVITKEIKEIKAVRDEGTNRILRYNITTTDGLLHTLANISQNPKQIIIVNDTAIATCSHNYVPIINDMLLEAVLNKLKEFGIEVKDIKQEGIGKHSWRVTAIIETDVEVPVGHMQTPEKFSWGIAVTNSYDKSVGVNIYLYSLRMVCTNGLYMTVVADSRAFRHIEKNHSVETLMERISDNLKATIECASSFFEQLDRITKSTVTPKQVQRMLEQFNIRKYEALYLGDIGIDVKWDHKKIESVNLNAKKMATEYDLLNAFTSLAQRVGTKTRAFELQTDIIQKIISAR